MQPLIYKQTIFIFPTLDDEINLMTPASRFQYAFFVSRNRGEQDVFRIQRRPLYFMLGLLGHKPELLLNYS